MATFNKRHYEAFALVCQQQRELAQCLQTASQRNAWQLELEHRMADMFRADNSAFNRERFLFACVPGRNVRAKTAHLK